MEARSLRGQRKALGPANSLALFHVTASSTVGVNERMSARSPQEKGHRDVFTG